MTARHLAIIGVWIAAAPIGLTWRTRPVYDDATAPVVRNASRSSWSPVWGDEFDQPDGSAPNSMNWGYDTGGGGWGNEELQYYTARSPTNVVIRTGRLVITALSERYTGSDGVTRSFTSTRLHTQGRFALAYGRFEARIKVPRGKGLWPAFWMLGDNVKEVGWPECGEIDILENIGSEPWTVHGTLHGPGYSRHLASTGSYTLPDNRRFADDFHVYAVEWEPREIRFYVDQVLYKTTTAADLPAPHRWIFDHAFFLILNVAVGGEWPGTPDASTAFPQVMEVDYVRVYQRRTVPRLDRVSSRGRIEPTLRADAAAPATAGSESRSQ